MLDALYVAAIGLEAQKAQLDALASNLSNLGTTAFKRQSVDFSAILDRTRAGRSDDAAPVGESRATTVRVDLRQGEIHATGRALDVAIAGAGFLEVELPGERIGYSRAGSLQINPDGVLSTASGHALKVDIRIPGDARDVRILPDGSVLGTLAGDTDPTVLGQIELATFANAERLQYRGEGVFSAPEDVELMRVRPGEDGTEVLVVESLEGSNIRMTDEMVSLLLMQRIYELNARVAQVADELIGMSNNLRRS